MAILGTVA